MCLCGNGSGVKAAGRFAHQATATFGEESDLKAGKDFVFFIWMLL